MELKAHTILFSRWSQKNYRSLKSLSCLPNIKTNQMNEGSLLN